MANRYWVGGTATWDSTTTANWSDTSGGAPGASVPTANDDVFFDQASTYTVTFATTALNPVKNFTVSAGTVTFARVSGTAGLSVYGNFSATVATTWTSFPTVSFVGTGNFTITTTGTTAFNVNINNAQSSWVLQSALTISSFTHTAGALDTGGYNLTATTVTYTSSAKKTLDLRNSTFTVTNTGTSWTTTAAAAPVSTFSLTGVISLTGGANRTFAGNGGTYPTLNNGSGFILAITGNNTFTDITTSVRPSTVTLAAGTTTSLVRLTLAGVSGSLATFRSNTTSQAIVSYPGAFNVGANSTDAGNNSGVFFTTSATGVDYLSVSYIKAVNPAATPSDTSYTDLRSFTERRRF